MVNDERDLGAWRETNGEGFHSAALSGRPFLAFGTPRYGHAVKRQAIVHFETGRGCRENGEPFEVEKWQPLPAPPIAQKGAVNGK